MNEHQLRCFKAAATYLNFTKAAQDMFMTQAAMTYQIGELEKSLGVLLFDRIKGKMALTAAGAAFLASTEEILREMDKAKEHVAAIGQGATETLRVGCYGDVMHPFLPETLRRFHPLHSTTSVSLSSGLARHLVRSLNDNEIDLAFLTSYGDYVDSIPWIEKKLMFTDSHVVCVPADSLLATREALTFADLKGEHKFAVSEKDLLLREDSITTVENMVILDDPQSVFILVAGGYGVCVCVSHVAPYAMEGVAVVPMPDIAMNIYACWKKDRKTSAISDFVECAQQVAQDAGF